MIRFFTAAFLSVLVLELAAQDVIIENWDREIVIADSKSLSISDKMSIKILNEDGQIYSVFQGYEDKFTKVTQLKLTVYDSRGKKVKKLGLTDINKYNFNASYTVDDSKQLIADPEYRNYPYRVEIESTMKKHKGFLGLPFWMPRNDYNLEVQSATLTVTHPYDYVLNQKSEHLAEPIVSSDGEVKTLKWEVSGLEALDNDLSYRQLYDDQPKLLLGPSDFELDGYPGSYNSWAEFGDWYLRLNEDEFTPTAKTKAFLDNLDTSDTLAAVKEIFGYMQSKSRYVLIALGIGGYQSLPSTFVDEKGYGDCKALSNYMKKMLEYKGIKSNFILVMAGGNARDIFPDFQGNQFNHVFLAVPIKNDTIRLECTDQLNPAGYYGTFTDDRTVLWLEEGKSEIIKMPAYTPEQNKVKTQCDVKLDQYGNATINVLRENLGTYYDDIRYFKSRSESQTEEYLYSLYDFKDFVVRDFEYAEHKGDEPSYACKMDVVVNNMARNASNRLLIPVNILPDVDTYFTHNKYQKYAHIRRAFSLEDKVIMELPEQFRLGKVPESLEFKSDYGSYTCELTDLANGKVEIKRKVILNKGTFKNEDFEEFNEFITRLKKADDAVIVLTSGT